MDLIEISNHFSSFRRKMQQLLLKSNSLTFNQIQVSSDEENREGGKKTFPIEVNEQNGCIEHTFAL